MVPIEGNPWFVAADVLPAIRKDGAYIMGDEKVVTGELSEDELIPKARITSSWASRSIFAVSGLEKSHSLKPLSF